MEEQTRELHRQVVTLQQHIARAVVLAEQSILPPPPQIDQWRNAINWQPVTRTHNEHEDRTVGRMRLGGMTPADVHHDLPVTFHISNIIDSIAHVTFFCDHTDKIGQELVWEEQGIIIVNGQRLALQCHPSHRVRWNTFTVRRSDWIYER